MNNDKNKFSLDFDFDDIDFASIGQAIKSSVNGAIRTFTNESKKKLPAIRNPEICEQKQVEKNKSILLKIGAVFVPMTLFAIAMDSLPIMGFANFVFTIASFAGTVAAPILMWKLANHYKRLSINYSRYKKELGNNTIISIRDLASAVSQTEEQTIKDLLYFMKQNYFKQARIVENDSIFILDIPTFKLYKDSLDRAPFYKKDEIEDNQEGQIGDINKIQAQDIIDESDLILNQMKDIESRIRSLSFRANLKVLFANISDILNIIKKYPEKAVGLSKFNDYYMPTSLKLIKAFEDFEIMNTDDPRIKKSMDDIEESIKTIGEAFANIKVDLLADRTMDVKTDIDTIRLILNQEGLLEGDFKDHE